MNSAPQQPQGNMSIVKNLLVDVLGGNYLDFLKDMSSHLMNHFDLLGKQAEVNFVANLIWACCAAKHPYTAMLLGSGVDPFV